MESSRTLSTAQDAGLRFFGARTNVTLRELHGHRESWRTYCIMAVEVFFGGVKARLFVLRTYNLFYDSSRTETLGRLGPGRREQRHHLSHWVKDIAVGFHSGKSVLYRPLRRQSKGMAQS
jgi:hypothetical protein